MENYFKMVQRWIDDAFDPSLNSIFRKRVADLLPSLKTAGTFKSLCDVLEVLSGVCQGGFYADGGQPPTLRMTFPALSENEMEKINEHYLLKAKEFEASVQKFPGN